MIIHAPSQHPVRPVVRSPFGLQVAQYVYGIRWDSVNDVITPGILQYDGKFIENDYDELPIQEQMGRYLLTSTGEATKLQSDDSTKIKSSGATATLDGSAGQSQVILPRFNQIIKRGVDNPDLVYFLLSEESFSFQGVNAWAPRGFRNLNRRWCGAYEAVAASDSTSAIAKSIVKDTSGYAMSYPNPFANRDRGQFRTQCSDGVFHQFDWGLYEIIAILFVTEYKTWNSQDVLPGYTERGSWDYSYTFQVGQTVSLGDASGSIYDDGLGLYIANSFRGVENIFGHVWQWIDGINIDNRDGDVHVYVAFDPANFADDTTSGYTDTGHAPGFGDNNNYIRDVLGQGQLCPFYPSELGGDSSSYITDYMWNSAGAWRVMQVGGHLSNGGLAGLAALAANGASSTANSYFGARVAA